MDYEVVISARAQRELDDATAWIGERSPENAQRWHNGFIDLLATLENHPQRCALAPESVHSNVELRQILYGKNRSYRAAFTVADEMVKVVAIRHTARAALKLSDFDVP